MMAQHAIHRVTAFEILEPYVLRVCFEDHAEQIIDFQPVLEGELYSPLRDITLFNQVLVDPEVHTLVWPNGADFDPETLRHWDVYAPLLADRARCWATPPATA
jgi:hypothetical protein